MKPTTLDTLAKVILGVVVFLCGIVVGFMLLTNPLGLLEAIRVYIVLGIIIWAAFRVGYRNL